MREERIQIALGMVLLEQLLDMLDAPVHELLAVGFKGLSQRWVVEPGQLLLQPVILGPGVAVKLGKNPSAGLAICPSSLPANECRCAPLQAAQLLLNTCRECHNVPPLYLIKRGLPASGLAPVGGCQRPPTSPLATNNQAYASLCRLPVRPAAAPVVAPHTKGFFAAPFRPSPVPRPTNPASAYRPRSAGAPGARPRP